jgi:hypothetical protein
MNPPGCSNHSAEHYWVAALFLALAYVIAAGVSVEGLPFAGTVALGVLIPLLLIWFPEEVESWFRSSRWRGLPGVWVPRSPAWLVAAMGWVFLVGIPRFVLLRAVRGG